MAIWRIGRVLTLYSPIKIEKSFFVRLKIQLYLVSFEILCPFTTLLYLFDPEFNLALDLVGLHWSCELVFPFSYSWWILLPTRIHKLVSRVGTSQHFSYSHIGTSQIFLIFPKTTVAVCHGPDFHFYRQKSLHKLFTQIWNNWMLNTYIYTIFLFRHASPSNKMLISRRGGGGGGRRRVTKYIENIYTTIY